MNLRLNVPMSSIKKCLEGWIGTFKNKTAAATCPTCRFEIAAPSVQINQVNQVVNNNNIPNNPLQQFNVNNLLNLFNNFQNLVNNQNNPEDMFEMQMIMQVHKQDVGQHPNQFQVVKAYLFGMDL